MTGTLIYIFAKWFVVSFALFIALFSLIKLCYNRVKSRKARKQLQSMYLRKSHKEDVDMNKLEINRSAIDGVFLTIYSPNEGEFADVRLSEAAGNLLLINVCDMQLSEIRSKHSVKCATSFSDYLTVSGCGDSLTLNITTTSTNPVQSLYVDVNTKKFAKDLGKALEL